MFLFFSKLTGFLLVPALWLLALLIWLFVCKSAASQKKLKIVIAVFIFIFGNEYLYTTLVNAWQPRPVQLSGTYQAGILLGGLGSFDKEGTGYLNGAADRLVAVCTLYKAGVIKKIIVSAGNIQKDRPNEADYLARRITALGINAGDIIAEGRSRTTFENALYTKKKIDSMHLQPPFVLVTSAIHIPRAVEAFKKTGIDVVGFPCNYDIVPRQFSLSDFIIPKLYIINDWSGFLKEIVGLAGYKLFGKA